MDELINRQAAIDALKRKQDDGKGDLSRFYNTIIQHDIEAIMQLPPIQPEIVRCGECKWFQCNMRPDGYLHQGVDDFECRHWCGSCDPTDFCSYGEKERGGQDG